MKTMGTCGNCQHWEDCAIANPELYNPRDWGNCRSMKGLTSALRHVAHDFGCVHWQGKINPSVPESPENTLSFLLFSCAQRVSNRIDDRSGRQKGSLTPPEAWERMSGQQKTEWAEESESLAADILECLQCQRKPDLPNYPTTTAEERMIEDMRRENNAAFRRIQQLSEALFALGYDPTQLP